MMLMPDPDVVFFDGGVAPLMAAFLVAVHGWAARSHTDGTLELRRSVVLGACPECEQDLARLDAASRLEGDEVTV